MRHLLTAMVLLPMLSLCSCGSAANSLQGSVASSLNLTYTHTNLSVIQGQLVIEYDGSHGDVPCKLAINPAALGLHAGSKVDNDAFLQNITLTRSTVKGDLFPAVKSGDLEFEHYDLRKGQRVSGNFFVIFNTGDTVYGDFSENISYVE